MTGCSGSIPVEQGFQSPGSNCGHWQENCFGWELMTPAAGSDLPLSRITIAGLEDLGYQVDYGEAEAFDVSNLNPSCICDPGLLRGRRTLTLTNTTMTTTTRQLSDLGLNRAMAYGRMQLSQIINSHKTLAPPPDDIQDLGQEVIYVLYEENQSIHRVMVTVDDLF